MGTFYYALTDENGVLCVDQLNAGQFTEEQVQVIAPTYPSTIYFQFPETLC